MSEAEKLGEVRAEEALHVEASASGEPVGVAWGDVELEVLPAIEAVVEAQAKAAADRFYEEVLETVQDYLSSNVRFNIASRLATAERERQAQYKRAEKAVAKAEKVAAVLREFASRAEIGLIDSADAVSLADLTRRATGALRGVAQ